MPARRYALLCLLMFTVSSGCSEWHLSKPFISKEELQEKERQNNVREAMRGENGHSRMIGDYIKIGDNGYIKVQGVGLVDRLDGTGEDPPASHLRTMLLEDLRQHEVKDPQTFLSSSNTALVVVTAYIPPICKKGEKIDVEVTVPDGSETVSLAGGWLMPCYLREMALMNGEVHEGKQIAIASGPVLIDALADSTSVAIDSSASAAAAHRRGRIPGAATFLGDSRSLTISIRNEYATVRMSRQIAERIGKRFHDYDEHGIRRPLSEAKTNSRLELIVHERYRNNYPRYLQCIRAMRLTETPVDRHMRMQQLAEEINFGPTAESAALQLEAIGADAIPVLKNALLSPDLEARFHAGCALAYLGNADGVPALKEAAENEPAFRIFALAALSTINDGASSDALRSLANLESVETRYGAFRSFSTMAPSDPFVKGEQLEGNFSLHGIESSAKPLIHLTRYKKAEVVVFDHKQEFLAPLMLRAGNRIILQSSPQGDRMLIKRIAPGEPTRQKEVSLRVMDVIRGATELGANYPDIVQMLVQAERQRNLPGGIAIDQLPEPGRVYERPASQGPTPESASSEVLTPSVTVGSQGLLPNLFDEKPPEAEYVPSEVSVPTKPKKATLRE
ncbi:flagellar basal body P-ring protein FlgI [Planctomicrobium sp. SH661]|uniref:flagellar basal body P-ring protein FlgI n=1 Tax=Planctomicrobium sp. SH661 TaxID=3448124 RepID=UPI003F5BD157